MKLIKSFMVKTGDLRVTEFLMTISSLLLHSERNCIKKNFDSRIRHEMEQRALSMTASLLYPMS